MRAQSSYTEASCGVYGIVHWFGALSVHPYSGMLHTGCDLLPKLAKTYRLTGMGNDVASNHTRGYPSTPFTDLRPGSVHSDVQCYE